MAHTPRPHTPRSSKSRSGPRGISTLIGNGWLRESPRNLVPVGWEIRSKSALRKCMFLPVPQQMRDLAGQLPPSSPLPLPAPRAPLPPLVPGRQKLEHDVRLMPAFDPRMLAKKAAQDHARGAAEGGRAWWEDPIAIGSLLLIAPPIGLAAVWSSRRYSSDARWALTVMTALTMCLVSAVVAAVLVR